MFFMILTHAEERVKSETISFSIHNLLTGNVTFVLYHVSNRIHILNLLCDFVSAILGKSHYLLYGLVAALRSRMLVTFDEELRPLPVQVRVGTVCIYFIFFCHWGHDQFTPFCK